MRQTDFASAASLLQHLGFAPDSIPDDYHQKWSRGTTIVELHFDVENPLAIDFDVEAAWRNAQQGEFEGQPAWQLAPQDEFLYVCLHGVRHRFDRLSLILDVAFARRQLGCDEDLQLPHSRSAHQTSALVLLGCAMAQKLLPTHATTSRMDQLGERLWNDLLTKPPTQQDWASMHRFYLEIEPTRTKRLFRRFLHLRIFSTRIIDEDFRFAARFGLQRRWQVWFLRYARLVLGRSRFRLNIPPT